MEACYEWINKPRIITYSNPRTIMNNPVVRDLITRYPHLCASDTLLMGLNNKYQRSTFNYLATVDSFIEHIFKNQLNSREKDLQIFIDISNAIAEMDSTENTKEFRALMNNRGQLVDAFKLLTMIEYEAIGLFENREQEVFFDKIYSRLSEKYISEYKNIDLSTTYEDYKAAYVQCLINDIKYNLGDSIKGYSIEKVEEELASIIDNSVAENYKNIIAGINSYDISTVVIHGIARFTPQIMLLIRTLDRLGINIVFLINYAENLPSIYDFWKKTYEWVGVEFECVEDLDLSSGNTVGKNIAQICEGIRPTDKPHAEIIKYSTITDFTDGPVRSEFIRAELKANEDPYNRSALGHMKTQYYAVSADRPNDILRNYFPNQFLDKPFLSYPIGQFIKSLFDMWSFDNMEMLVDFNVLKECASVRIGHNSDNMVYLLENIKLYFKDVERVNDVISRLEQLGKTIQTFDSNKRRIFSYLSYFSVDASEIELITSYIRELDSISNQIFGSDKAKEIDYQGKFKELVSIVNDNILNENVLSQKENELINILIQSLSMSDSNRVVGSVRELRDALNFFLSVKREHSGADWIVRGFDQIDGAPLMKMPPGRIYEFAMMSMKNMTKTTRDILPWPLDESVFSSKQGLSIYLTQVRNNVELRNEYLRFYFFYGAFFSKGAQIKFSYIENDNGEKQRPYYLLDLLDLPIATTSDKKEKVKFKYEESDDYSDVGNALANKRELNIFSICPYKYFLIKILGNELFYSSEYHTNYFIENEIVNYVEIECGYNRDKLNEKLEILLKYLKSICPYLDDATLSDVGKYVRKNFSERRRNEDYLQKKRDFLVAKWKDLETSEEYMNYNKSLLDVKEYMRASRLFPQGSERPHEKICEECNYNELCLNYYRDKEVEI